MYFERYEITDNIKKIISVWYTQTNDFKDDINVIDTHGSTEDLNRKKSEIRCSNCKNIITKKKVGEVKALPLTKEFVDRVTENAIIVNDNQTVSQEVLNRVNDPTRSTVRIVNRDTGRHFSINVDNNLSSALDRIIYEYIQRNETENILVDNLENMMGDNQEDDSEEEEEEEDEEENDNDDVNNDPDYVPPRTVNDEDYLPYSPHSPRYISPISIFIQDDN